MEPGESLAACLRRELQEELGIDADIGKELWRTRFQYAGRAPFELVFFAVQSYRGTIVNHDFAEVRWVSRSELTALDFLEGDREVLDLLSTTGGSEGREDH